MKIRETKVCLRVDKMSKKSVRNLKKYSMKKISSKNLRLNKINVSKLNSLNMYTVLGGNIPDPTKNETCEHCDSNDTDTCTRTTVDFGGQRSQDTNC